MHIITCLESYVLVETNQVVVRDLSQELMEEKETIIASVYVMNLYSFLWNDVCDS